MNACLCMYELIFPNKETQAYIALFKESVKEFRLRMLRENKDTRDNKKLNVAVHDVYEKVFCLIRTY